MSVEALVLGLVMGLLVGLAYFHGLWWTAVRLPRTRRPGRLLLASYGLRTALVLASFALLVRFGAESLLAALVGFVAARTLVVRRRARSEAVTERSEAVTERSGAATEGSDAATERSDNVAEGTAGSAGRRTEFNDDPLA